MRAILILFALATLAMSCDSRADQGPRSPTSASVVPESTAADPSFIAIEGATGFSGLIEELVYRIEVPDEWNGSLVVYVTPDPVAADPEFPGNRNSLVRAGFAWMSGGYRVPLGSPQCCRQYDLPRDYFPALQDIFERHVGEPRYVYAVGASLGGGRVLRMAETEGLQLDGALAMCTIVDSPQSLDQDAAFFLAAAYVAGVRQDDWETGSLEEIYDTHISRVTRRESPDYARFEQLWLALTGGERPFGRDGLRRYFPPLYSRSYIDLKEGTFDNREETYHLSGAKSLEVDFNANVLRIDASTPDERVEFTGDLQVPVLTLHTTGDANVPLGAEYELNRRVSAKGRDDLLVQRTVQDPDHCTFTPSEVDHAFGDLVDWVRTGSTPAGEDFENEIGREKGAEFTEAPRAGSSGAARTTHVQLSGNATLDESPVRGASLDIVVREPASGRLTRCSYDYSLVFGGFERWVATGHGMVDCGAPTYVVLASIQLPNGETILSTNEYLWEHISAPSISFEFSSEESSRALPLAGDVFSDTNGSRWPRGATVEAYAGALLCARATIPTLGPRDGYFMLVPTDRRFELCSNRSALTFVVDGRPAERLVDSEPWDLIAR